MEAIFIVGAGGIGCAVGHALCSFGVPVVFVETDADKVADGNTNGVRVDRKPARKADFVAFTSWSPPTGSVVLLCTKCPDNAAVLARLPAGTLLVPIQNGFDDALENRPAHVEGIASFVSECLPGKAHTRITRRGRLHIGIHLGTSSDLPPHLNDLADNLVGLLRHAPFVVVRVSDIRPWKYTNLMYNAAIGPLAAAAGLDNGELLRWRELRELFFALLRENHAILRHARVALDKVGPFHPSTVAGILARPWLAHALAWAFYPSLRGTHCSMAGDLRPDASVRTEIDNYNGHLIRLAGDFPCPLNRLVCALVRRMEQEHLPPSRDRLLELWAQADGLRKGFGVQATAERPPVDEPSKAVAG